MPTITIRTESGVVFELRPGSTFGGAPVWVVIASVGRQSITAEAIVGMVFTVGDAPLWYAKGYAQIVQSGLNQHHNLHSPFGIGRATPIITEVQA